MLASVMIQSNQLDELAPNLIRMLELEKDALPENLLGLNRMFARNSDRQAVFKLIDKVCLPFFGIPEAHYAVSMAASSAGIYERALSEIQRALELRPDWEMAALLEAQLLSRESPAKAISFLQDFVVRNPGARDLQLNLARVLIAEKRYTEARQYFDQLLKDYPDKPEVVYSVALLALQQNDFVLAERLLKKMLTLDIPDKNPINYYLGQIAEEGKHNDEALAYYAKVGAG
jgi:predicted Zn-dependent protease